MTFGIIELAKALTMLSGQPNMDIDAIVQKELTDSTATKPKTEQVVEAPKGPTVTLERHIYTSKKMTQDADPGKTRLNVFYELPGEVNGYSFIEFEDGQHFNRNILSKHIYSGAKARMDIKNGSHFKTNAGLGLGYDASTQYDNLSVSAGVKWLPLWVNTDGKIDNLATVTVSAGTKLKLSDEVAAKLSAFGEINYAADGGTEWAYGEWKAAIESGKFEAGIGGNLLNKEPNSIVPQNQFKVNLTYRF